MAEFGFLALVGMGVLLGLLGGGGAAMTIPILMHFFEMDFHTASFNSFVIIGVSALLGSWLYLRQGLVSKKVVMLFLVPSLLGVYVARKILLPMIPDEIVSHDKIGFKLSKDQFLYFIFCLIIIRASLSMIFNYNTTVSGAMKFSVKWMGQFITFLFHGFYVGIISGLLGIGGGFLIVPALVNTYQLKIREAAACSLLIVGVNMLTAFGMSDSFHLLKPTSLILFTLCAGGGMLVGVFASKWIPHTYLKPVFGVLAFLLAVWMIFSALYFGL